MKKVLIYLLTILFISANVVYAANWVTIKASNGKTALLDTQNIDISNQYVKYWVKATKSGYTYRYYMMSDCSSQTSCIIETYKYDSTGKVVDSSENGINLEKIVPDTLNEALYRNVCEIVRKNPLSIEPAVWTTYLEDVSKQIKSSWKPKYSKTKEKSLIASVSYKIDKNGNILSREITQSSGNEDYDNSVNEAINTIKSFTALPSSFEGDLEFMITFNYAIKGDAIAESVTMNSNGIGEILISKSKFHPGEAVVNGVVCIIALPFVILGALATQ